MRVACRAIGYIVGAFALLQLSLGVGGLVSWAIGHRFLGHAEVVIGLGEGVVLLVVAGALLRGSRQEVPPAEQQDM